MQSFRTTKVTPARPPVGPIETSKDIRAATVAAGRKASGAQKDLGLENLVREFLKEEKMPTPWYIVMPTSTPKLCWDYTVLTVILVAAVTVPGQLAYSSLMADDASDGLERFHALMLAVYGVDVLQGFCESFQDPSGSWALTLRRTSANYLHGRFAIDLIALVPWRFSPPPLSLVKVLRLSRVLTNKVSSSLGMTSGLGLALRFVRMLVGIALLVHWISCLFFAVSPASSKGDGSALEPSERYVLELYNAFSMMLGERLPIDEPNVAQSLVAMGAMLTGALVVATVFGNVAVLVSAINIHRTRLQGSMAKVAVSAAP